MSVAVVTSCSSEGFKSYGLRFLDTFHRFWPAEVDLFVVSEDELQLPVSITGAGRNVHFLPIIEHAPQPVLDFYARHADNKVARGMARPIYDFRRDAWKFSKKVFAIGMAAARTRVRNLVWLDADVVTYAPVTMEFLKSLPPQGFRIACLDRGRYHSECGFVSYVIGYTDARDFIAEFERLYTSDEVFALPEWHDSFVFDWLRKKTAIRSYKIPHTSAGHPFVNSCLGKYMDHLKGNRKQHGVSRDHPRFHKMQRQRGGDLVS